MARQVEVDESPGYRVMPGMHDLLERLVEAHTLLGLVTGNIEAAHGAGTIAVGVATGE